MNYKASGTLLGFAPIREEGNMCIIITRIDFQYGGAQWVVSKYIEGEREWVNGHYFSSYNEAHAYFVTEVLETLKVGGLSKPPRKLQGLVEQTGRFLGMMEAGQASN